MTDAQFWNLIRETRTPDPEEHAENLTDRLARLPVADILAFGRHWVGLHQRGSTRELWAAAYLINGGCDADDFPEFVDWLILQGESVFSAAAANPDSLADVVRGEEECLVESGPAYEAYCMATEQEDFTEALTKRYPELTAVRHERRPVENWPFTAAEFRARLPRLAGLFLEAE